MTVACFDFCHPQGDQGPQGPPGPFEYVNPPEDLYVKGDKVGQSQYSCSTSSSSATDGLGCKQWSVLLVPQGNQGLKGVCGIPGIPVSSDQTSGTPGWRNMGSSDWCSCVLQWDTLHLSLPLFLCVCVYGGVQGTDTIPGIKGEKGIPGYPGLRVSTVITYPSLLLSLSISPSQIKGNSLIF